jgi:hypothetical protein
MNIFSKKKLPITLNFFLLILVFYFSFYIYPSLNYDTKVHYKNIETNSDIFFTSAWVASRSGVDRQSYIELKKNDFLTKFIIYLNSEPNIKTKAPCPNELIKNNLRNIQIYPNLSGNPLTSIHVFNVRFNLNKLNFYNQDLSKLDQCFYYFFVENLNKFFILYRENLINDLTNQYNYKSLMGYNYPDNFTLTELKKIKEFINKINFFINPNANYSHSNSKILKQNTNLSEILFFLICSLIILIINIIRCYKKKFSKIINDFINS